MHYLMSQELSITWWAKRSPLPAWWTKSSPLPDGPRAPHYQMDQKLPITRWAKSSHALPDGPKAPHYPMNQGTTGVHIRNQSPEILQLGVTSIPVLFEKKKLQCKNHGYRYRQKPRGKTITLVWPISPAGKRERPSNDVLLYMPDGRPTSGVNEGVVDPGQEISIL